MGQTAMEKQSVQLFEEDMLGQWMELMGHRKLLVQRGGEYRKWIWLQLS